jgi:hypothetical protein
MDYQKRSSFQSVSMDWHAGAVETLGLQLCSVENPAEGRRERRADNVAE